ncbi:snakin-2-like [Silene latifolia]|uniref:snakin-2-like n=1 Tax=Silene latifolia TaxID=37657 RepID=UPI003D786D31
MTTSKALIVSLFFSLLVLHVVQASQSNPSQLGSKTVSGTSAGNVVTGAKIDCTAACGVRCSATKRPNLCKRACGSCCRDCNCVPPGTSGNYEACPCYANKTTHGNIRKCP